MTRINDSTLADDPTDGTPPNRARRRAAHRALGVGASALAVAGAGAAFALAGPGASASAKPTASAGSTTAVHTAHVVKRVKAPLAAGKQEALPLLRFVYYQSGQIASDGTVESLESPSPAYWRPLVPDEIRYGQDPTHLGNLSSPAAVREALQSGETQQIGVTTLDGAQVTVLSASDPKNEGRAVLYVDSTTDQPVREIFDYSHSTDPSIQHVIEVCDVFPATPDNIAKAKVASRRVRAQNR